MASLETRLDPTKFVRVHRSTIVNAARIVTVHTMVGGVYELELRGGTRIDTGRQYRDRIRNYSALDAALNAAGRSSVKRSLTKSSPTAPVFTHI